MVAYAPYGHAGAADWVGVDTCKGCHEKEYATWKAGPHARAAQSLKSRVGDGRCESCHGTGDAPAGRFFMPNVQCEACHGAGQHYAKADIMKNSELSRALGLRDLSNDKLHKKLCFRCHQATTSLAPFDATKAWSQIRH
jgi:hypothetical protein